MAPDRRAGLPGLARGGSADVRVRAGLGAGMSERSSGQCLNPAHLHGDSAPVSACLTPDPYGARSAGTPVDQATAVARPVYVRERPDSGRGRESDSRSEVRRSTHTFCPASATHTHDEGSRRDGRCTWCEFQFTGPAPRPNLGGQYRSELDLAYRRAYDPDYGTDYWDSW